MALRILIDQKSAYTAGDVVYGSVRLIENGDVAVQCISIVFSGRSKSKIQYRAGNTDST